MDRMIHGMKTDHFVRIRFVRIGQHHPSASQAAIRNRSATRSTPVCQPSLAVLGFVCYPNLRPTIPIIRICVPTHAHTHPIFNPQSPIPNPQSPIPSPHFPFRIPHSAFGTTGTRPCLSNFFSWRSQRQFSISRPVFRQASLLSRLASWPRAGSGGGSQLASGSSARQQTGPSSFSFW